LVTYLLLASPAAFADARVQELLTRADAYRLESQSAQVEVSVESFRSDKLDKERRYLVYTRPQRQSLVLSRSPIERGQKILMLADDFWLVLPASQRPIRISPAQKLLGEASTGDIATMTWAGDYDGEVKGDAQVESVACTRIDLVAQRRGATYARIELYLSKADARPVRADLFVASDRIAKRAAFELEQRSGREIVSAMVLFDQIQPARKTVIHYLSRASKSVPDDFYNPMFLTRGELPE
jgi:hypothetical protein